MSFTPFGGFPTTLATIPHFAVGKFQQAQDQGFVSIPSSQGLQIAVSTVDPSQLNHHNLNGHVHVPTSSTLQIQNQMLNTLLSKTGQNDVFVKVETEAEENERFQQQHHQDKTSAQQDISSLNEYLSRFSGPPTFPFQQMYKYPTELIHVTQIEDQQQQQQNMMSDNSPSVQTPEQQQQQQPQAPKKAKKKKKRRDPIPGLPTPRRRSTSLQPALTTALDGSTLYGCPQCHTVFNNREAIETHLTIHRSERPFICNDCGAALKRKEHLDRHRSSHMTERPHPCPVCSKTFKRIEHLQRHSIIHRTDKVHRCSECGKGFNRKDHLTKHIHSHLAKRIKQELGQQPGKGGQQQGQQNNDNNSTINIQQHQSVLAHLH
ncbi:zinc finger protein 534 [Daphnia magna]|uniref:Uncharacterized protein n=2 Tax=Daphnia magna TaxID=35525 RepID=A0ABQ9YWP5_9CRUS|nr:zinc finger protein 534 [Daphnia magna]KAK4005061.1 hypothetical protein OUZ56_006784 [Daphnia magna]KZS18163.1 putative Zinc finger protein 235 [Daphnia magna]